MVPRKMLRSSIVGRPACSLSHRSCSKVNWCFFPSLLYFSRTFSRSAKYCSWQRCFISSLENLTRTSMPTCGGRGSIECPQSIVCASRRSMIRCSSWPYGLAARLSALDGPPFHVAFFTVALYLFSIPVILFDEYLNCSEDCSLLHFHVSIQFTNAEMSLGPFSPGVPVKFQIGVSDSCLRMNVFVILLSLFLVWPSSMMTCWKRQLSSYCIRSSLLICSGI